MEKPKSKLTFAGQNKIEVYIKIDNDPYAGTWHTRINPDVYSQFINKIILK